MIKNIEIWNIIDSILKQESSSLGFAYLSVRAYGHGLKKIASLFKADAEKLEQNILRIDEKIIAEVIKQGGSPEKITNIYDNASQAHIFMEENEEEEDADYD